MRWGGGIKGAAANNEIGNPVREVLDSVDWLEVVGAMFVVCDLCDVCAVCAVCIVCAVCTVLGGGAFKGTVAKDEIGIPVGEALDPVEKVRRVGAYSLHSLYALYARFAFYALHALYGRGSGRF